MSQGFFFGSVSVFCLLVGMIRVFVWWLPIESTMADVALDTPVPGFGLTQVSESLARIM